MKKIYRNICVVAALMSAGTVAAQNLDPTVEISRAYEGKITEANKPVREMTVPDSLSTFRLDFDYSVFEKPYRGAYDFSPYSMSMRPAAASYDPRTFYLKAGAGYRLHPELDLIWSPSLKNGLSLDVYAEHNSYVGDYRQIGLVQYDATSYGLDWADKQRWKGYDLMTKAGANLNCGWNAGIFGFNVNYFGIAGKESAGTRAYDAVDVNLSLSSNKDAKKNFVYRTSLYYRFGEDKMHYGQSSYLDEHLLSLAVSLGPVFKHGHRIVFDFGFDGALYRSKFNSSAAKIYFVPHYLFNKGRFTLDAGVRLDAGLSSNPQQFVYPDIKMDFVVIKDAMSLYAAITGGASMNLYSKIMGKNHHFNLAAYKYPGATFLIPDMVRVKPTLGIKGRIMSEFSYDLRGGYVCYANSLVSAIDMSGPNPLPAIGFAAYQKAFAALDWRWDAESFKFDGAVTYTHSWGFKRADWTFAPAMLTGNVAFEYNWMKRIYAGVDCSFSTSQKLLVPSAEVLSAKIPGYADLGISAEYVHNRKLSFWLRGGNLCCMTIQRTPLYAEGGINFTAGICLNL
jgi:hypothetical protein